MITKNVLNDVQLKTMYKNIVWNSMISEKNNQRRNM